MSSAMNTIAQRAVTKADRAVANSKGSLMTVKLTKQKLLFWIEKGYNVLLEGKHGVGKTALISAAFEEAGLKYRYFSGSTLDPFIDFCGVPIKIDAPSGKSFIKLIRPEHMASDDIDAIFIDEYNRTHKKVRNATMELIQFGTINGIPLRRDGKRPLVWAAVNPDSADNDGLYDTDRLDPAQRSRFHIQVALPYDCDDEYFSQKYGDHGVAAVGWWRDLSAAEQDKVCPRTLDYAIQLSKDGADLRDCLPYSSNPGRLAQILAVGPADKKLQALLGDDGAGRRFLSIDNNYQYALKTILGSDTYKGFFLPLLSPEKMAMLFSSDAVAKAWMLKDLQKKQTNSVYSKPLMEVATAGVNLKQAKELREELERVGIHAAPTQVGVVYNRPLPDMRAVTINENQLQQMSQAQAPQTYHRKKLWNELERAIPQNMSSNAAQHALTVCNVCCESTPRLVERDMSNMVKLSNFCILVLLKGGHTVDQVKKIVSNHKRLSKFRLRQLAPSVSDIHNYLENEKRKAPSKDAKAVAV